MATAYQGTGEDFAADPNKSVIAQGKRVNSDVQGGIVTGPGHWLMEEAPAIVVPKLLEFLNP